MPDFNATPGAAPVDATNEPSAVVGQTEERTEGEGAEGGEQQEAPKELTAAEKAAKALERRVARLTRERYEERARHEFELEQARKAATPPKSEADGEKPHLTHEEVEQRARTMAAEIAEANSFNDRCNKVFEEGKKLSPTFADDLKTIRDEVGPLFDKNNRPTDFMKAILDADAPARLLKHFADDIEAAAEIEALPLRQQIRRIALLEQSMGEASKPKPSTAPKPVAPVRGGGGGTGEPDADKDPVGWIKWSNEQLRRR
jgi:hypothetical protein